MLQAELRHCRRKLIETYRQRVVVYPLTFITVRSKGIPLHLYRYIRLPGCGGRPHRSRRGEEVLGFGRGTKGTRLTKLNFRYLP